MPLQRVKFAPTMVANNTPYSSEGFWRSGDKVRFTGDYPESIGGWQQLSSNTYLGTARSLTAWKALDGKSYLGIGTHLKYYIENGGVYNDITPIRDTAALTDPFETIINTLASSITASDTQLTLTDATDFPVSGFIKINSEEIQYDSKSGNTLLSLTRGYNSTTAASHNATDNVASSSILVTDTSHGAITNDFVTFSGSSDVGGILAASINVEGQIKVINNNTYFFDTGTYPTSATTGGGSVTASYQINVGLDTYVIGVGWGSGGWGSGGWGSASSTGIGRQLRLWTNQNFGEDLIFGPRGGEIFYWDATSGVSTRGVYLSSLASAADVPTAHNQILVTESRFVIAFGATPIGSSTQDPMLIRWSDQEIPQIWTPLPTNLAGSFRLAQGTEIITAVQSRQEILVWTDSALYSMQFSEEFGFVQSLIDPNISIAGPNAVVLADNRVFWFGKDKFYEYNGRVMSMPCSVGEYVFDNINSDQLFQVYGGTNEEYDEVWWFYTDNTASFNNRYVIFNHQTGGWCVGSMMRTAWLDTGIRANPLAAYNNHLYTHEVGVNDGTDNNFAPINAYIESADFGIGEGESYMFVRRILPDISFGRSTAENPTATITLEPRPNSGRAYQTPGATQNVVRTGGSSATVEIFTEQVDMRVRGRQVRLKVESNSLGTAWRLGVPRIDAKPDGRRA